jgi:acyl-coenzyme A synthetase/AMP-(fatty) acid ligase
MSAIFDLDPGFRASQTFDFSFDPSVSDMLFTWDRGGVLCVVPEEELMLPHEFIKREGILFTWDRGGVLCVVPEEELMLPHEFIKREGIDYWNSVPSIANFMWRMGHLKPGSFPTLRHSMFCGEQFPQALANAWREAAPNSTIENLYGPTEATIYISRHDYTRAETGRAYRNGIVPIGRPFLDHECRIVDDSGTPVESPEIGEIVFSGPQVTRGYNGDPVKTAAVFVRLPWDAANRRWYRTGDLGFVNEDGNVECIGRRDNQIKLGGRRIEIGEIEAVLAQFLETRDVVVVPVRDAHDIVVGCVGFTTRVVDKDSERRIRQESLRYLDAIFFPKRLITIERMPLSTSGKTDRKALERIASESLSWTVARP